MMIAAAPDRPRTAQGGLLLPASPEPEKLELTMTRLANLVGDTNVGSPQLLDTHRPDGIRMGRFRLIQEAGCKQRSLASLDKTNKQNPEEMAKPANGLRLFRPEVPTRVELRDGRPARVFFQGQRGEVVATSGPWRTSGDWWQEKPWDHDEWDVELHFSSTNRPSAPVLSTHFSTHENKRVTDPVSQNGLYVVYYDSRQQSWFLQGMYD